VANDDLTGLADLLDAKQSTVTAIGIRSEDNVADSPSRGVAIEEKRRLATLEVIRSYIAGQPLKYANCPSCPTRINGVKHGEMRDLKESGGTANFVSWFKQTAADENATSTVGVALKRK
jgi:hypothetical protein